MSYQVLARKYRPATFQELEGQEHVLQALINALDNDRLHHAYLFTGTRGVGKTTIARILAKCLNCEQGVKAIPCGECGACREIAEGRSVDLLEVDAASRTGVDDMRELLDNVQYMPTVSRFKIYLIDEVHMLSRSSFNAMLKTLEEPPAHVKFLFATTDPKKLPITVLSRCLQFNLKNLSPEQIVRYLGQVLKVESIPFEDDALWQLGHAADGSMRDALSLTDQAISFGNNQVMDEQVKTMLGAIDQREVYDIINAIVAEDGGKLLARVAKIAEFTPDYAALLDDILSILHRVAIAHAVPDAVDNSQGDRALILATAQAVSAEQVQLFYQIGLIGQRDLPLAPVPRIGLEMVLLRMMSFAPAGVSPRHQGSPAGDSAAGPTSPVTPAATTRSATPAADILAAVHRTGPQAAPVTDKAADAPTVPVVTKAKAVVPEATPAATPAATLAANPSPAAGAVTEPATDAATGTPANRPPPTLQPDTWPEVLGHLGLVAVAGSLAANCSLQSVQDGRCTLILGEQYASLWNEKHERRIAEALGKLYEQELTVTIIINNDAAADETPAQLDQKKREQNSAQALATIEKDPKVQQLIEGFDGKLDPDSVVLVNQGR